MQNELIYIDLESVLWQSIFHSLCGSVGSHPGESLSAPSSADPAPKTELAPVLEGVVRGQVLAGVRAVGVAVSLHHSPLHVGVVVLWQSGFAPGKCGTG